MSAAGCRVRRFPIRVQLYLSCMHPVRPIRVCTQIRDTEYFYPRVVSFGYLRRSTSRSCFAFLRALKPDWSISAACDKHWPLIGRSKLCLHVRVTKMHARAARACAQKSRAHAAQQGVTQNLTQRLHGSRLRRKAARLRRRTKLTSQTVRTAGAQVHEISWHAR